MDPAVAALMASFANMNVRQKKEFKKALVDNNQVLLSNDPLGDAIVVVANFLHNHNYGANKYCDRARAAYDLTFVPALTAAGIVGIPTFDAYLLSFKKSQNRAFKYDHFKEMLDDYEGDLIQLVPMAGPVNPPLAAAIDILIAAIEWMDNIVN